MMITNAVDGIKFTLKKIIEGAAFVNCKRFGDVEVLGMRSCLLWRRKPWGSWNRSA